MLLSNTDIVFSSDSPKWHYMKKQVMAAMKQHGDGLKNLENKTLFCGNQMLKIIEQYKGKSFEPGPLIHMAVAHIMLILVFGQGSKGDASEFIEAEKNMEEVLRPVGAGLILDIVPFLRYFIPSVNRAYRQLINVADSTKLFHYKHISARRKLYDHPNVEVFIDHFIRLNIMNQEDDAAKNITETDICSMGKDMFGAGMATTSKTMVMMLAILVNHPEIQDTTYREIDDEIGRRQPKMEDKLSMPYTQALILETLRYHSVLPFAVPHRAKCDSDLQGYHVPAGTIVFPNLWALHHDERYWKSPWEFNPNRWLEDGKILPPDHVKKQRLLAFGCGKRQCPGEVFARNRLFILTTLMLQKFKFIPAQGHPRPNNDPSQCKGDWFLAPGPYKLSVEPRH